MRMTQQQVDEYNARNRASTNTNPRLTLRQPPIVSSPSAKRQKYGNRKVTDAAGNVHDSTKEYRRWQVLELRERAGEIRSLRRQVPYALVDNGILICTYIADFVYVEGEATIVEDVKSPPTRAKPEYRIKVKLMQSKYAIQVREV